MSEVVINELNRAAYPEFFTQDAANAAPPSPERRRKQAIVSLFKEWELVPIARESVRRPLQPTSKSIRRVLEPAFKWTELVYEDIISRGHQNSFQLSSRRIRQA